LYGIVPHWVLGLDVQKLGGVSIVVLVQKSLVVMGKTFYGQGLITPRQNGFKTNVFHEHFLLLIGRLKLIMNNWLLQCSMEWLMEKI